MTSAATKTAKPTAVMSFCADVFSADGPARSRLSSSPGR
jgi:hypothetical protein